MYGYCLMSVVRFILTILALTCIFGTMIDILNKNITEKYKWLIQFSWYKNGKTLLTTNLHADSIPILHGIRFFSIAWVVLGHVCQFSTILPQINYLDVMDNVRTWRYLIFTNAVLAVDTCFLLSGILLSYIFIKSTENGQQFNLPVFYLHRLLRILPVLGLIILLQLSLISRLGSGPLWDIVMVDGQQKNCEQYWWATLLFIQNYVNIKDMCVPAAWYLSVDMQMYWFSPIFLLALRRKPKFGIGLLVAAAILGIVLAFQQSYYHLDLASSISTIVANGKEHIPKKIVALAWTFSFIICIGVIHWLYPFEQKDYEYNAVQSSLYLAVARPLWAIGVFLIIFLCHCGYGGKVYITVIQIQLQYHHSGLSFITSILEWKALVPLSRLTFCIYLIHPEVLLSLMATTKLPGYMTGLSVVSITFFQKKFSC
ncbi:hypothetical protein C0J52_15706 [Blattella germanica]|nr:hypothetical protein C0J52_15706 [Blattella germanica]